MFRIFLHLKTLRNSDLIAMFANFLFSFHFKFKSDFNARINKNQSNQSKNRFLRLRWGGGFHRKVSKLKFPVFFLNI